MSITETWRQTVLRQLEAQAVNITHLPHGTRLVGLHGDVVVSNLASITPIQLAKFSRIYK